MKEKLQKIREDAIRQIEASGDLSKLNDVRVAVLGKKNCIKAETKINEQILKPKKEESSNKHIKITPLGGCKKHADSLM